MARQLRAAAGVARAVVILVGALAIGGTVAFMLGAGGRSRQLRAHAHDLHAEIDTAAVYAIHVSQILDHLQQVLAVTLPGVTLTDFVERGILGPARDMLMQTPGEDVRLSILVPHDDRFRMPFAAGHRLPSQQRFEIPIDESLSRFALRTGQACYWPDVNADPDYRPHPRGDRPWCAIYSFPIKVGEKTVGVFNVVSTEAHAFGVQDLLYVEQLGSIVNVAASAAVEIHGSFPGGSADTNGPALERGQEEGNHEQARE